MSVRYLLACALFLSFHTLNTTALSEVPREALEGAQQAVATKLDGIVRSTLDQFFKDVGQDAPEHIDVGTAADFDVSKSEPVITEVKLAVTLISDLPPEVVRQARQELVRAIKSSGYRTEASETGDTPVVRFSIDSQPIDHSKEHTSIREIAVFIALLSGALLFAGLAVQVILWGMRPLRRDGKKIKRRPRSSRRPQVTAELATQASAHGLPKVPVNYWIDAAAQDLPPFPSGPNSNLIPGPERH